MRGLLARFTVGNCGWPHGGRAHHLYFDAVWQIGSKRGSLLYTRIRTRLDGRQLARQCRMLVCSCGMSVLTAHWGMCKSIAEKLFGTLL